MAASANFFFITSASFFLFCSSANSLALLCSAAFAANFAFSFSSSSAFALSFSAAFSFCFSFSFSFSFSFALSLFFSSSVFRSSTGGRLKCPLDLSSTSCVRREGRSRREAYTCAGVPLSHHSSFPFVAALPMGKGHGNIRFSRVVKNTDGCALKSSHGDASAGFSSFFSRFSSFFSSLRDEDEEDEGFSSTG